MEIVCQQETRREKLRTSKDLNGIDYIEIHDADQPMLIVCFIAKAPTNLTVANIRITGGRRVRDLVATDLRSCQIDDPECDDCLIIKLNKHGDLSTYTLCIVVAQNGHPTDQLHPDFDRRYACHNFSFKELCPSDLDCKIEPVRLPQQLDEPEVNHLAKDYASFRQLILDRLSLVMPDWHERLVPDMGIALVEVLAYTGDHLSYYQDAVATEAYLDTARRRISVRRHARLVDYAMHEGCNARTWVHIRTASDVPLPRAQVSFITGSNQAFAHLPTMLSPDMLREVPAAAYDVFEPMGGKTAHLYEAHNEIHLYTWGDSECCLPKGATRATLSDEWLNVGASMAGAAGDDFDDTPALMDAKSLPPDTPIDQRPRKLANLHVGQFLLIEELYDPKTGNRADADPGHRHVVRLKRLTRDVDALYDTPVVEVEWDAADALPFPVCISATSGPPDCRYNGNISVARGNIILADHGRTLGRINPGEGTWEDLGSVLIREMLLPCDDADCPPEIVILPGVFRGHLRRAPLTYSQPLSRGAAASTLVRQDPHLALPQTVLEGNPPDRTGNPVWSPRTDLLSSRPDDRHYVVEMDDDGGAHIRFGDGELGQAPASGMQFRASYRVGNGPAGNVGAESITHIVLTGLPFGGLDLVPRNPLPAQGGTSSQPVVEVKLLAPQTFRRQLQRAITAADYAAIVERDFADKVQSCAAQLLWNGSWYEVTVAVDQQGRTDADPALLKTVRMHLEHYRRMGHDLHVVSAQHMPLKLTLRVCVKAGYQRGHMIAALRAVFSNWQLPDGRLGFFHPDKLTFGQDVYLSQVVALAQSVEGVDNVTIEELHPYGVAQALEIEDGVLALGPFQIAQLDNDPNVQDNGVLELKIDGGR